MTYRQFDVVVVPFPFADSSSTKKRSALVIKKIGKLATSDRNNVQQSLQQLFNLGSNN